MRVLLLAVALIAASPVARAADLDTPPERTPYVFSPPLHSQLSQGTEHRRYLTADVDHDGLDEVVLGQRTGFMAQAWQGGSFKVCWQFNAPARFQAADPTVRLGAAVDLSGDGRDEIVAVADAGGAPEWRLWVYDSVLADLALDVPLPTGEDVNGDGRWDGDYEVAAVLPGPRPLALLVCEVGYDRHGRGLRAHDLRTGAEVWRYEMGNNLHPSRVLPADLDGDGRPELVLGGSAPDNLGGERINGTSDDACYVIVLGEDGVERWRRRVSGPFSMTHVAVADLENDGRLEILTATNTHAVDRLDRLSVWSGVDGELLGHRILPGRARGMAVLPAADRTFDRIAVGCYEGGVHLYEWDGEHLGSVKERLAQLGLDFLTGLDLLPEPGVELVLGTRAGRLLVLSPDLRTLAALPAEKPGPSGAHLMYPDMGGPLLLLEGSVNSIRGLEARPLGWRDRLPGLSALTALVLLAAVGLIAARRRGGEDGTAAALPRPDQRRRLLQELELSGHGAVAATRSLRRYVWLLESLLQGGENRLKLLVRIGRTGEDLLQEDLPRLAGILELARATRQDAKLVDLIEESLDYCRRTIGRLAARNHADDPVVDAVDPLTRASERVEQGLLTLRTAAESYYRVDACRTIDRILMLREDELAGAGVDVVKDRAEDRLPCRIDPGTLRFVLDNLVGNAVEAMLDVEGGELIVSAYRTSGLVLIRVCDNGCGITPEDAERIFQAGFSSRPGGGMGLYRSRELLRDWGGELSLEESIPGVGSTFILRLVSFEEEPR